MGPFEYGYRQFKNSKLATFVDKHTHNPISCTLLGYLVLMLISAPLVFLVRLFPRDSALSAVFGLVMIVLVFAVPFAGGRLIPKLSDHFDWAGKIALAQMKKSVQRTK